MVSKTENKVVGLREAEQVRALCIVWVLQGVVSFRSVPRLLRAVNDILGSICSWVPHFTSVINWTQRIGLGLLGAVAPCSSPWIALMDMSIDIGTKKALVVLRVKMEALALKKRALDLSDCECIGVHILEHTCGEHIAESLETIFAQSGTPAAILKDQGSDLARGVKLWREAHEEAEKVEVIDDIGHALANGLKAQFEKSSAFQGFTKLLSAGRMRLQQTQWAHLMPPKLRSKGRFQSIGKSAQWGIRIATLFGLNNGAAKNSALAAARKAFPGLLRYKAFIYRFAKAAEVMHRVLEILKHSGLNSATYAKCKEHALSLPATCKLRKRLLDWLERHLQVHTKLGGSISLQVSTDILESLFGKFKRLMERSPISDMNRMALVIPALCGPTLNEKRIKEIFAATRHADIATWEQNHIRYTLCKQRRAFFAQNSTHWYQKPGIYDG